MKEQTIPDFMKGYCQGINLLGKHRIEALARQYADEQATFLQTTFLQKQEFLRDWNQQTGQRMTLTAEEALKPIQFKYSEEAKQLAMEHGYKDQRNTEEEQEQESQAIVAHVSFELKADTQTFLSNLITIREKNQSQQVRPR